MPDKEHKAAEYEYAAEGVVTPQLERRVLVPRSRQSDHSGYPCGD